MIYLHQEREKFLLNFAKPELKFWDFTKTEKKPTKYYES
jgi:hypothetical protein